MVVVLAWLGPGNGCTNGDDGPESVNGGSQAPRAGDIAVASSAGKGGGTSGKDSAANAGTGGSGAGGTAGAMKPVDGGVGADARTPDDGQVVEPGSDACARPPCAAAKCDDDRPCAAPDTICLDGACAADPGAPGADSPPTTWSGRVGRVGSDDRTLWCTPVIEPASASAPARVSSDFQLVALDGAREQRVTASDAAQRVRVQCFEHADLSGPSTTVTGPWSADGGADLSVARCPEARPHAAFARCQLAAAAKPPFVYAGAVCGDGVTGIAAKPVLHGQLIGDHYELPGGTKPLFNNTGAQNGAVVGTDLGYQFLAQGRMYIGFGDTWENDVTAPGPNGYRGSVLANTRDFDPSDGNGIVIEGWDHTPERPNFAREIVPCPHDQSGNTEFTAIGTSGFGLSEAGAGYRFVWFAAIKTWEPYFNNASTLAWSRNGEAFVRADRMNDVHAPRWPFESHFGPAAIWVDREQGYVYFFGVKTYTARQPLRLARVRATLATVLDHLQYEYWTGSGWQKPDAADEYALARSTDTAADLIPGTASQSTRPEISVAYNPYAGRFIMMVHNDPEPFENEPRSDFQLWQASAPEGPWTLVNTGENLVLPSRLYGAYMSEQTFSTGGRDVYFALSDWNLQLLALGQPYVVGLWSMELQRKLVAGCEP